MTLHHCHALYDGEKTDMCFYNGTLCPYADPTKCIDHVLFETKRHVELEKSISDLIEEVDKDTGGIGHI